MVIWLRKDNGFPTSMQKWDKGGNCKHADRKLTRKREWETWGGKSHNLVLTQNEFAKLNT